jgi:hypothetical protein
MDIPLEVKGFTNLIDSLQGFTDSVPLSGSNKFSCSNCNSKQDASRDCKFLDTPPILTFSLLRLIYDFKACNRVKVTSEFAFPMEIDFKPFLVHSESISNLDEKNAKSKIYKLYSIILHSGSAYEGHYHAYIYDIKSESWFDFNDSSVLPLGDINMIQKAYGNRDECAYMLLYRRSDLNYPDVTIPQHLREIISRKNEALLAERELHLKIQNEITIEVLHEKNVDLSPKNFLTQKEEGSFVKIDKRERVQTLIDSLGTSRFSIIKENIICTSIHLEGKEDDIIANLNDITNFSKFLIWNFETINGIPFQRDIPKADSKIVTFQVQYFDPIAVNNEEITI